jgi:DNA polymerase-3 subunit gamma/tau
MEVLGSTLVEMRHAPDPRLLLEVAMVKLSSSDIDDSADVLSARISALEEKIANIVASGGAALPPAPVNSATGRARIGGRAVPQGGDPSGSQSRSAQPAPTSSPGPGNENVQKPTVATEPVAEALGDPARMWPQIVESLKPLARAMFRPATVESVTDNKVTVRLPANTPVAKAEEQKSVLTDVVRRMCGSKYSVTFVKDDSAVIPRSPAQTTIEDVVAQDEHAPVDPGEILPGEATEKIEIEALHQMFPGGKVEKSPESRGRKKK